MGSDMLRFQLTAALLLAQLGLGFQSDDPLKQVAPIKGGIRYPVQISKQEPKYTDEAKAACIAGTILLQLVVDEEGAATQIEVLRPLGFGLDENAVNAVLQWRWRPGTRNDKPVKVASKVEVNFQYVCPVSDKADKQRTAFNAALRAVQGGDPDKLSLKEARDLASEKYPPGMYLYGKVLEAGRGVTADPDRGFHLIEEAANKKYGPALYEVAMARIQGIRLDKDLDQGMELMRSAARLGSRSAETFLGQAYEKGDGVPVDFRKSREYFRLCAAAGDAACQFALGKSLLEHSDRPRNDYVQAIAWLQLASDSGKKDAATVLDQQAALTPAQAASSTQLKSQLVYQH
jgi:TonB family protein